MQVKIKKAKPNQSEQPSSSQKIFWKGQLQIQINTKIRPPQRSKINQVPRELSSATKRPISYATWKGDSLQEYYQHGESFFRWQREDQNGEWVKNQVRNLPTRNGAVSQTLTGYQLSTYLQWVPSTACQTLIVCQYQLFQSQQPIDKVFQSVPSEIPVWVSWILGEK